MDLKQQLAQIIKVQNKTPQEIADLLTTTPSIEFGDFALPCFAFAKEQKKAPAVIAAQIAESLQNHPLVEKTQIVGGYLNFYLNRSFVAKQIFEAFNQPNFFVTPQEQKHVCIEFSSPNLAKFMHIGHYNCTIYGEAIAKMYEFFGHKVTRINYVGDYGTPFGKMVLAYKKWGSKQDVDARGVDAIQDLYIKFNQEENDELLEQARKVSKNIEDQNGEDYQIYKWFIDISLEKTKQIYKKLGIWFDDWSGESTYNGQLKQIVEQLKQKQIATQSQGATIVDLSESKLGIAVVERSDGGSLYITRDLVAIEDRYNRYQFDKHIYVTASQQNLHFAQLIEICRLLGRDYWNKLEHVSYGLFSTPEGKIASRKGKQAILEDILAEATNKASAIIQGRTFKQEDPQKVALEIAKGAMAFSIFKVEAIKDKVFDMQTAISFDGDTAPYLQYTYARCASLVRKSTQNNKAKLDHTVFENNTAYSILLLASNFKKVLQDSFEKREPSILARALLDIAKMFNSYYAENTILQTETEQEKIMLVSLVKSVLSTGLNLLCINVLEEM
jgi:arginyl-tRNA synthetase